jgi:hypothetical protein
MLFLIHKLEISGWLKIASITDIWGRMGGLRGKLCKFLKSCYGRRLGKIEAHFSPEEFASLKTQIKELKSKKGF